MLFFANFLLVLYGSSPLKTSTDSLSGHFIVDPHHRHQDVPALADLHDPVPGAEVFSCDRP